MSKNGVSRSATRTVLLRSTMTVVLVLVFAVAASAYTLVFRSGLRSEIPDEFTLTKTTLTYEVAPGFTKTILVSLIDIPATERANNQPYGTFFKPREQPAAVDPQPQQAPEPSQRSTQPVRTVTNLDLAGFRQRRLESEKAYEQRRVQLGLPTVAESRRRQAEEADEIRAELRERSSADKQEERYWRSRARELRTEIAALDNQINYARGRLGEINSSAAVRGSWTSTYPIWPQYDPWGRRGNLPPPIILGPYGYPNQYPGYPPYGYPNQYPYGYPNGPYDSAQQSAARERDDMTYKLNELLMRRAGLAAQWQALEDEARDARVPQAWLEP
jgi:hypothetical protein